VSAIAEWLASLCMSEYTERFAEDDIDFDVLRELTDQDFEVPWDGCGLARSLRSPRDPPASGLLRARPYSERQRL
jgi:hypothetical protein